MPDAFFPGTYLFEGRVVGITTDSLYRAGSLSYASRIANHDPRPPAGVLIVEPVDFVYGITRTNRYAITVSYEDGECKLAYASAEGLGNLYEQGDLLYVIAEARYRKGGVAGAFSLNGSFSHIAPLAGTDILTSPWSIPDLRYEAGDPRRAVRAFEQTGEELRGLRSVEQDRRQNNQPDVDDAKIMRVLNLHQALRGRMEYELQRDLGILHYAKSDDERIQTLVKIRSYWNALAWGLNPTGDECSFAALVERYLRRDRARERMHRYVLALDLRPFPTVRQCDAAEQLSRRRALWE